MSEQPQRVLTWSDRRALELELWLEEHLAALAEVRPEDLDDPARLRALGTRARELADVVERVRLLRGDVDFVEREISAFRNALG